ncbi:MAG: universal stress protein, partial [Sphingobacterium sp.]
NSNDRSVKEVDADFKSWIERIEKEIGISDISYIIKPQTLFLHQRESLADAITSVLIDEQVDFLVITKSRKNVFRKLIQPNVVKKLAFSIKIPTFFARVLIEK